MTFIADFHVHSKYSRATSKKLDLENLHLWAQLKGITVIGAGDFTHPEWFQELSEKLEPAAEGLYKLRDELAAPVNEEVPSSCRAPVYFMLATEISSIYKQGGKTRKVHNLVLSPSLETAAGITGRLARIGNVKSDGRPILGLPSKGLLEIVLEVGHGACLIPAHIWTPWFSVLGSKSGFDSIEECFGELSSHIFALETGLSSDPPMNWRLSNLDRYTLVSNSDAHSPAKLGREANLFSSEIGYHSMIEAMKSDDNKHFKGTIEFFPEEGKYHLDGHRKCGVRLNPQETSSYDGICPKCGKPVVIGVMNRVEELADRPEGAGPDSALPCFHLTGLSSMLGEILKVGAGSKKVNREYMRLLSQLGPELDIMLNMDHDKLSGESQLFAECIRRMRAGEVFVEAGYDGEYGMIKVLTDADRERFSGQKSMFEISLFEKAGGPGKKDSPKHPRRPAKKKKQKKQEISEFEELPLFSLVAERAGYPLEGLNKEQRQAANFSGGAQIIAAGPGTGKTRTLALRIMHLVKEMNIPPENILAVTFTNRAAREMRDRLRALLSAEQVAGVTACTFHALGYSILSAEHAAAKKRGAPVVYTPDDCARVLRRVLAGMKRPAKARLEQQILDAIGDAKQNILDPEDLGDQWIIDDVNLSEVYRRYQEALEAALALDYDDLIFKTVKLLEERPQVLARYRERFKYISVDEYQDINLGQHRLLKLLCSAGSDLTVIGDPDQAIYGFRGARREFFFSFSDDYPGARQTVLARNYRSAETIINAAKCVIEASDQEPRRLFSGISGHPKIEEVEVASDLAEAEFVAHSIEETMGGVSLFSLDSGRAESGDSAAESGFGDFAVLYRTNAQANALATAFSRLGIPFQQVGRGSFYASTPIREVISYLRLLKRPESDPDIQRVLNFPPRGLSEATAGRLADAAAAGHTGLWEILCRAADLDFLSAAQKQSCLDFIGIIGQVGASLGKVTVKESIIRILELSGISKGPAGIEYASELQMLALRAAAFDCNLDDFLAAAALEGDDDSFDQGADKITLCTLHGAKGLEFPVVFITGCEDGLIPFTYKQGKEFDRDEERRLFYVGMTRAIEKLYLTYARRRFLFGNEMKLAPSAFLKDIRPELKNFSSRKPAKKLQKQEQLSLF
jgi:DNA helicase-2/ATP-dependent DNA helicase PcrA